MTNDEKFEALRLIGIEAGKKATKAEHREAGIALIDRLARLNGNAGVIVTRDPAGDGATIAVVFPKAARSVTFTARGNGVHIENPEAPSSTPEPAHGLELNTVSGEYELTPQQRLAGRESAVAVLVEQALRIAH